MGNGTLSLKDGEGSLTQQEIKAKTEAYLASGRSINICPTRKAQGDKIIKAKDTKGNA